MHQIDTDIWQTSFHFPGVKIYKPNMILFEEIKLKVYARKFFFCHFWQIPSFITNFHEYFHIIFNQNYLSIFGEDLWNNEKKILSWGPFNHNISGKEHVIYRRAEILAVHQTVEKPKFTPKTRQTVVMFRKFKI